MVVFVQSNVLNTSLVVIFTYSDGAVMRKYGSSGVSLQIYKFIILLPFTLLFAVVAVGSANFTILHLTEAYCKLSSQFPIHS